MFALAKPSSALSKLAQNILSLYFLPTEKSNTVLHKMPVGAEGTVTRNVVEIKYFINADTYRLTPNCKGFI